ncbi:MAG TPA: AraC family transcriptional regulator, partial [Thermoanaerobaculia bacterium]|nr:AraC family transcriptional regulator [Thermoanaerobaculia bacterium]
MDGSGYSLSDYSCRGHDSPRPEESRSFELVFVRRGMFVVDMDDDEIVLTPNEVWYLTPGTRFRIRHPQKRGDECTILRITTALRDDYPSAKPRKAPASNHLFELHTRLRASARSGEAEALGSEEMARAILDEMSHGPASPRVKPSHKRLVRDAQQLLAARFTEKLTLADIARAVGSSGYHLARIFRQATGESLHGYRTKLRLREALGRIAGGERDLAALALDAGFCDQSHFTNAFRRAFGVT